MDQCMNCTVRGDLDACMETPCSQHESWYAQTLKAQRTWIGLTDDEVGQLAGLVDWNSEHATCNFSMEVEAKLKEKNT